MSDQVLAHFRIKPDRDLDLMRRRQSLFDTTARLVRRFESTYRELADRIQTEFRGYTETRSQGVELLALLQDGKGVDIFLPHNGNFFIVDLYPAG